ncbi:MAG TPA: hypothetical protein VH815_01875 [Acidobacteriota bacterium]
MNSTVQNLIENYHDLLTDKHLDSTVSGLSEATKQFALTVAGRPVCNVLRPLFLTKDSYKKIWNASHIVMQSFRVLAGRLMTDENLRKKLNLTPEAEEVIQIDTGFGAADVSSRLDGFWGPEDTFYFVEYNADSPGGIGFGDVLAEVFLSLPIMKEISRSVLVQSIPVRQRTFEALMNAYLNWGGKNLPAIAIVDWKEAVTYNEFLIMQDQFQRNGCSVIIADPSELELRNGTLYAAGQAVQLVYKRVVSNELIERCGLQHPLIEAVRTRAVCMANGFAVQMLFNKMLFAFLSDPAYGIVSAASRPLIDQHIPWTRTVQECKTIYEKSEVDLLPFISEQREKFVLKPVSEYGGKGVVLGWECSNEEWNLTLQSALSSSYVVQERVPISRELYPAYVNGRLTIDFRYFDLDPYVWEGMNPEGCGVRLSRAALLNVSAGGGSATPMLIVGQS